MDNPERYIPMLYRQEAILQNPVMMRLSEISAAYLQRHREYKEIYPADDARPWTFQKIAQSLAYYRLSLCFSFGILTRTDNMGRILEPGKAVRITPEKAESVLREYEQYLTFSFFHVVFSSFESSMRSIVATVSVPNKKGKLCRETDKFSDIYHGLIQYSGVNDKYQDLFELLLMVRNCIHNRSIYLSDKGSRSIVYNNVTYDFVQGRPIKFATIDFFFDLLLDVKAFFEAVYESEALAEVKYIKDHVL